jgi:hypothetical protein
MHMALVTVPFKHDVVLEYTLVDSKIMSILFMKHNAFENKVCGKC